jgi:Secretion system C-terminal sorting domain
MKLVYTTFKSLFLLSLFIPFTSGAQQITTVITSANCVFTYSFNITDEGFSSPSIYSNDNDFGLYWNGSQLTETAGAALTNRTASTISPIFTNTETSRTTLGFDYSVPAGTQYRIRIVSGVTNPPLEILATTSNGPLWSSFPSTSGSLCLELQDADLPPGSQIRYEISFRTFNTGVITLDNFRKIIFSAPLPVTFLAFIARETTVGIIQLLWNVADEVHVNGYEVETSIDGINFTTVGFVPANGKANYSFSYNGPIKETRFFRVRNIDIDNRYQYTGIIRIQNKNTSTQIKVYPVPATAHIFLEHPKQAKQAIIQIINTTGIQVLQTYSLPNSYQTSLNLTGFKPGVYFIIYTEKGGQIQTTSFIKN